MVAEVCNAGRAVRMLSDLLHADEFDLSWTTSRPRRLCEKCKNKTISLLLENALTIYHLRLT